MKYEVKVFVQTTETYIVEADSEDAAVDAAVDLYGKGVESNTPGEDWRIVDTDAEELETA